MTFGLFRFKTGCDEFERERLADSGLGIRRERYAQQIFPESFVFVLRLTLFLNILLYDDSVHSICTFLKTEQIGVALLLCLGIIFSSL